MGIKGIKGIKGVKGIIHHFPLALCYSEKKLLPLRDF